jgi:hypothetical protein
VAVAAAAAARAGAAAATAAAGAATTTRAGGAARTFPFLLLAVGTTVGASTFGSRGLELLDRPASGLAFERTAFDFGTVLASETVEATFPFRNAAGAPVRIEDLVFACGCLEAKPSARRFEPGEAGAVRVKLATHGRFGPQAVHVRVRTDEPGGGVLLRLAGTIRAVLRPKPPRVFLGDVAPGARVVERIVVEVVEPVEAVEVEGVEVGARLGRSGPGALEVEVELVVPERAGTRIGGVELRYRHAATGRALQTWIPVVWTVAGR